VKKTLTRFIATGWALVFLLTAALGAGVSIRGYFTSAFTDANYQRQAVNTVIANWKSPAKLPAPGKKTVFILRVNRDGSVGYKKLNLSSGLPVFDEAAEKCLSRSTPFKPLPVSFRYPYMEVHFHFEVVK
jgi:hypothetical protein